MATLEPLTEIESPSDAFQKIASGKVRDLFKIDEQTLLFVASDRISAFDVILKNSSSAVFSKRSMQVRRLRPLPLESIVRGYITGSAWSEYRLHGTIHGVAAPKGLRESERLPEPIWTPSTKAEAGGHDENISPERARGMVGEEVGRKVEEASLGVYRVASEYALQRGIIIADTKFEFALDESTGEIVLIDEVLTPDSSRFWPAEDYEVGRSQKSYDKQSLRDWLTSSGLKGKQGVTMPDEVVRETACKYREAYEKLTGKTWA